MAPNSESEKISFTQLNRKTGHHIRYAKVDADSGEELANEDIVKGYKVDTNTFIEEELEDLALELTRTIETTTSSGKADIAPRYMIRPYYLPRREGRPRRLRCDPRPSARWMRPRSAAWC
jgi:DNA end-binding protein Ku